MFYVPVELERYGRRLPEMIRGAAETLRDLGDFPARTRMLVLFAAVRASKHLPLWWHFYARFRLARLVCCRSLDAMRFLDKADIETWYARFPAPMRRYYDPDRLKAELLALFPLPAERIPYETARACLVGSQGDGALDRARLGP